MLKVSVSPGPEGERELEVLGSAFNKILEEAGRQGYSRIYSYPHPDSVVAGIFIFKRMLAAGVRPVISVSMRPPEEIDAPTVLLGYDSVNYRAGDVEYTTIAMSTGEIRGKPVVNLYLFQGEGSVSALSLAAVSYSTGYKGSWDPLIALAGFYLGRYVSRSGKLHGMDKMLADELINVESYSLEAVTSLKVYKPHEGDVCEAIERTSNPFYPSLTGDREYCKSSLEAQNLGSMLESSVASLTGEELERFIEAVISIVRERAEWRNPEDYIEEYVGGYIISRQPLSPIQDVRMAADALVFAGEVGGLASMVASSVDLEGEYQIAERALEDYSERLAEAVVTAKPRRVKLQIRYRVYSVDGERRDSPYLLWRALYLKGLVERDSIIIVEDGEGARISAFQAELAAGYGAARRLVESKVAEGEGLALWVKTSARQS